MNRIIKLATVVAASSVVGLAGLYAGAQGVWHGNVYVPQSSLERPQDVGVRGHTNHVIIPMDGLGPGQGMTPAQVKSFYKMPTSGGTGVIAVVDAYDFPNAVASFNAFAAEFNLPRETSANQTASTNKVFQVVYAAGYEPRANVDWEQEEALDIEWTHAMAPQAKIVLVEARSENFPDLYAAVDAAAAIPGVKEVSMSWGGSETPDEIETDSHFNKSGPLFFAASGDNGAGTGYPAVSPYVVGVGGTTVNTNNSGILTTEIGWTYSGGGVSSYEPKPAWQNGVANTGAKRSMPDISSDSDPNTGLCVFGPIDNWWGRAASGWTVFGGTSASTACMAGMVNVSGMSFASTTAFLKHIYSLLGSKDIRDITVGNNGYPCLKGWDKVTGIGVPVGTAGL